MAAQPYLFFEGRTEEALEFYADALGAQTQMLLRYRDAPGGAAKCPDGSTPPGDKVMHASLRLGDGTLMASDGFCSGKTAFGGFSLAFEAKDKADAKRRFDALAAGGKVTQPLTETFFADAFGMVTDKFGLSWMLLAGQKNPG
jgi:PhnB protein